MGRQPQLGGSPVALVGDLVRDWRVEYEARDAPFGLSCFLVRPSKYDDEGFVIRHWRAVVPSNSLACLYGLTEDVRQRRALGEVDLRIYVVDEAVDKVPLDRIFCLNRRAGERGWSVWWECKPTRFAGRRTSPWLFGEGRSR